MFLLVLGVLLWSGVHLIKSVAPGWRAKKVQALGEKRWKGIVSLALVASIVLMVLGWRSAGYEAAYRPPFMTSPIVAGLMFVSFLLFAGASAPGNIKRLLRHPMLTGTIVFSVAHLLANGDQRSIVLFGGIGLWAAISIVLINRREGTWQRPPAVSLAKDAMTLAGTIVIFGIVVFLHPYLFGADALPWFQGFGG